MECPRVAEVDKEPNADNAREVEQHVGGIALDRFPSLGEGVDHEGDGAESEEEKEVAVEGLHALAGAVDRSCWLRRRHRASCERRMWR